MCTPISIDLTGLDDLQIDPSQLTMAPVDPAGTDTSTVDPKQKSGTVVDSAAAGPDGAINAVPTPVVVGSTTKTPGPAPEGSTPAVSGTDPMNPDPATPATPAKPDPLVDSNTLLINSLTELAHHVTETAGSVLTAQTDAANALKGGFLDLNQTQKDALAAADQLRKNTGQASRKPSYSLSMSANRRANSSGNSSTMLTGSGGVPTNALALGRAQLLGGDPA